MRFSSVFQLPSSRPRAAKAAEPVRDIAPLPETAMPVPQDLPDELDARVRMIGEWQLGEG
ncbi:MAG: hypothetical protein JWP22_1029 [Ramlibacter sp.]|nr:hypothetical protein [Ramlibacter sp.]MDB5912354.1 hypothetical protein [Ramlibacter sp.]